MRGIISLFLLFVLFSACKGQFYSTGEESSSVAWSQIKTEHFQIVFPQKFSSKGKVLAGYLESVYKCGGMSLAHAPKKISVIVHANSSISNGMVAWAPKRMELYPVNNQDSYGQDWLQQLSLHEFRHVVQIDKLNVGFTKFLTFIFGQQATGAVVGLYLPTWFLEGDAVAAETSLSNSGRGRMPNFSQGLKAQLIDFGAYSFEKATLGSYKSYVPNVYELGYQMVAQGRLIYGDKLWEKAIDNSGKYSFSLNPFLSGIRDVSGYNKRFFYQSVMDSLLVKWKAELDTIKFDKDDFVTKQSTEYSNYLYPQSYGGKTIAEVHSPAFLSEFVAIDSLGNETFLFQVGSRTDEPFHLNRNLMVWSELRPSIRFPHKNYSVLRYYNLETNELSTLTHQTRYFAPKLNNDNTSILCVEFTDDCGQVIAIIDAKSGAKVGSIKANFDDEIISPIWIDNGANVAAILLNNGGKRIAIYDKNSSKWRDLTPPNHIDLSNLAAKDSLILFTSHNSNQDNLFTVNRFSKKINRITAAKFGNNYGSYGSDGSLLYSSYSSNGYRIARKTVINNLETLDSINHYDLVADKLSQIEHVRPVFSSTDTLFTVKKYSNFNIINFHSWGPYIPVESQAYLGASLMSQNILSNTSIVLGYNADPTFQREKWSVNISYKGWFPTISLLAKFGDSPYDYSLRQSVNSTRYVNRICSDKKYILTLQPKISVPINLSSGYHTRGIIPEISVVSQYETPISESRYFYQTSNKLLLGSQVVNSEPFSYNSMRYGIYLYDIINPAIRDVWGKGGISLELYYQNCPFGDYNRGSIFSGSSVGYLPGFFRHDGIKLGAIYELKNSIYSNGTRTSFNSIFPVARGFDNILSDEIFTFTFDYQVPLFYPDATLSGALYLKRVRMNLFLDHSFYSRLDLSSGTHKFELSSFGSDFWADVNFFQWSTPFQIGYRMGYKPQIDEKFYAFLWKVSF